MAVMVPVLAAEREIPLDTCARLGRYRACRIPRQETREHEAS
jgi:hypothetical protein